MLHGEYLTEWEVRRLHQKNDPCCMYKHNSTNVSKGYHCFIQGEISGKSLVLTVCVHPLDLRLGLFLGYEH